MQLALEYQDDEAARAAWHAVHMAFGDAVDMMGLKEVAYRLDVRPSQLADAIAERDRHRIAGEWIVLLLTFCPPIPRAMLVHALNDVAGFEGATPRRDLTPAEELAKLKAHLAAEAPGLLRTFRL